MSPGRRRQRPWSRRRDRRGPHDEFRIAEDHRREAFGEGHQGSAFAPSVLAAMPSKRKMITICSTSPWAMASKMLLGKASSMILRSEGASAGAGALRAERIPRRGGREGPGEPPAEGQGGHYFEVDHCFDAQSAKHAQVPRPCHGGHQHAKQEWGYDRADEPQEERAQNFEVAGKFGKSQPHKTPAAIAPSRSIRLFYTRCPC